MVNLSEEEKESVYNAAMDSVNLIKAGKPEDVSDAEWADLVWRNQGHLAIITKKEGLDSTKKDDLLSGITAAVEIQKANPDVFNETMPEWVKDDEDMVTEFMPKTLSQIIAEETVPDDPKGE